MKQHQEQDRSIAQEQADQVRRTTGATLAARALEEVLPALGKGYSPQETRKAAAKMGKDMDRPGFTPGPYHCNAIARGRVVGDETARAERYEICNRNAGVATVYRPKDVPLFKAAPDLYDALAECVSEPGAMCWDDPEAAYRRLRAINDLARAALARAKGGAA